MPATPEGVRANFAQATRLAREAATTAERDSRVALDRFKARSAGERFAALEDGALQLLPEHRRELLHSLREKDDAKVPFVGATAGHASVFEVWRGRLPFQKPRLIRNALLALSLLSAIGLAYRHMPASWVEVRGNRDVLTNWVLPDGRVAGDRLVVGRAYALMRTTGGIAELRDWYPGTGYAETHVSVEWLQTRSGSVSR